MRAGGGIGRGGSSRGCDPPLYDVPARTLGTAVAKILPGRHVGAHDWASSGLVFFLCRVLAEGTASALAAIRLSIVLPTVYTTLLALMQALTPLRVCAVLQTLLRAFLVLCSRAAPAQFCMGSWPGGTCDVQKRMLSVTGKRWGQI